MTKPRQPQQPRQRQFASGSRHDVTTMPTSLYWLHTMLENDQELPSRHSPITNLAVCTSPFHVKSTLPNPMSALIHSFITWHYFICLNVGTCTFIHYKVSTCTFIHYKVSTCERYQQQTHTWHRKTFQNQIFLVGYGRIMYFSFGGLSLSITVA